MKLFIDTADVKEIEKYNKIGIIDGVTTNPSLMAKQQGLNIKYVIEKICDIVRGPVSVEVISRKAEGMFKEAIALSEISDFIVVKIPATYEGYSALNMIKCSQHKIKTNFTVLYTANQALLAAKLGATYVSPFVGRLDVNSSSGTSVIKEIKTVFTNYQFKTMILAASMRTSVLVKEAALAGADAATVPPSTLNDMINNELSLTALEGFIGEWNIDNKGKTMLGEPVIE